MFVLGLILLLVAAALVLAALVGGADDRAQFDMGSLDLSVSTTVVFLLGAATLLLVMLGLVLLRLAASRAAQRRRESKELSRLSAKLEAQEAERRQTDDTQTLTEPGHTDQPQPPSGGEHKA